ncbi:MAG: c-type cytochrome [Acidobacteriota bacterium]|nr:c-type cytochrome [Acidobacteriota bacterium]MDH3524558.1 c-type cytochrome [Acidobacteriota bacterium]
MTAPPRSVRAAAAAALALAALGALGATGAAAQAGSGLELPPDPLGGRVLFAAKGCAQCHGIAGRGRSIGPNLGEGHFSGSFLELGASLWNHVPGMSVTFDVAGLPWPELEEGEMTELLAFLYFIEYLGRPGVAAAGQEVFADQGCAFCHEIGAGEGIGPDLAGLERFASPLYVAQEIWNHGPRMLASMRELGMRAPSFAEGDLADLAAYVRQQAEGGAQERLLLAPGDPNRGHEVFAAKGCSKCHGRDARGGEDAPDLSQVDLHRSAEGIAATMWNHGLVMGDFMRERGVGWPIFEDSELADLIAYLFFLPFADLPGDPARGAEVFASRSCADCHAAGELAAGGAAEKGPRLAGSTAAASPAALMAAMWNHAPMMKTAILGEALPWPELAGADLRDLRAFLGRQAAAAAPPP